MRRCLIISPLMKFGVFENISKTAGTRRTFKSSTTKSAVEIRKKVCVENCVSYHSVNLEGPPNCRSQLPEGE